MTIALTNGDFTGLAPWLHPNSYRKQSQLLFRGSGRRPARHGPWFRFESSLTLYRELRDAADVIAVQTYWNTYFHEPRRHRVATFELPCIPDGLEVVRTTAPALLALLRQRRYRPDRHSLTVARGLDGILRPVILEHHDGLPIELIRSVVLLLRGNLALSLQRDVLVLIGTGTAAVVTRTHKGIPRGRNVQTPTSIAVVNSLQLSPHSSTVAPVSVATQTPFVKEQP